MIRKPGDVLQADRARLTLLEMMRHVGCAVRNPQSLQGPRRGFQLQIRII